MSRTELAAVAGENGALAEPNEELWLWDGIRHAEELIRMHGGFGPEWKNYWLVKEYPDMKFYRSRPGAVLR